VMRARSAHLTALLTCLTLLACLSLASAARAESLERIWSAANEAYFRGDFAAAVKGYEQLEQAGVRDADVSFNLATAHARQGELGHAVLGFSRALWLRPGDDGAEEGLSAAQNVAAPLCLAALLLFGAGLLVKLDVLREGEPVIVLREGAPLREGPDDKALVRKQALEGQAGRVLRTEGAHSETVLDSGARGWMSAKDLGHLRPL
jgi:hypothetical protein